MRSEPRTVLVTGATGGIGLEMARGFAAAGDTTILLGRDTGKLDTARRDILRTHREARLDTVVADLRRQDHIRDAAHTVRSRHDALHVLVHNAGVLQPERHVTPDGIEETFAVNHLAPFLLTQLLLDRLLESRPARVVTVASRAHRRAAVALDDLEMRRHYNGWIQYSNTKALNVLFTRALARRHDARDLTANCFHPGVVRTGLWRRHTLLDPFIRMFAVSATKGADTGVWLGTSGEVEGQTGGYYVRRRLTPTSRVTQDADAAETLWRLSLDYTHLPYEETA